MSSLSQKNTRSYSWNSAEYWKAVELRRIVLRFPLGKNYVQGDFESEENELFFGCFSDSDRCLASISAKKLDEKTWKMRQFVVHPSFQKCGIGKEMVAFYEDEAHLNGINKIEFHARKTAVKFYQKLGYHIEGEEFLEVGIPHFKMKKNL